MDEENIKLAIGLITGVLVLTGATLTFINGRLSEARSPDGRERVILWTISLLSWAFQITGAVFAALAPLISIPLFAIGMVLLIINFARLSWRTNLTIALFCFSCSVFVSAIFADMLFYVIITQRDQIAALGRYESALVDNQNKQANNVDKLTETVGKLIDRASGQK
jgi:MFS family permease